ncbi:competence pheromone ComX [Bacillus pacificus]|uniref:competence pheromone ComX n=1 Tax=Bacillus TaxID=1386 RepID=UPI001FB249E7|nr:competence pheromone ComX [Bacillus sp. ZJS3]UOB79044.1 competence pheromone ComX [Bacillus sp. ZJS3]
MEKIIKYLISNPELLPSLKEGDSVLLNVTGEELEIILEVFSNNFIPETFNGIWR